MIYCYSPIPPSQEFFYFPALLRVIQHFKNAVVEPFGVGDGVCAGEHGGGT
jgi:hypothetical protein